MLERECAEAKVRSLTGTQHPLHRRFGRCWSAVSCVETSQGIVFAQSLVVATGGLSIPEDGSTGLGYEIASQFGLKIVTCRPGLVPLVFNPEDLAHWSDLSGLSAEVIVDQRRKESARPASERRC
jgi:predicted flavoprotein YhiN